MRALATVGGVDDKRGDVCGLVLFAANPFSLFFVVLIDLLAVVWRLSEANWALNSEVSCSVDSFSIPSLKVESGLKCE